MFTVLYYKLEYLVVGADHFPTVMSDVHDILELNRPSQHEISKAAILGLNKPGNVVVKKNHMKKPEGMHR